MVHASSAAGELLQQGLITLWQLNMAVGRAFALSDENLVAIEINVTPADSNDFTDSHPGRVHQAEQQRVSHRRSCLEQSSDFNAAEDDNTTFTFFGCFKTERDVAVTHLVECHSHRRKMDAEVRSPMAGINEILQVVADVFPIKVLWSSAKPPQCRADGRTITFDRRRLVPSNLHLANDRGSSGPTRLENHTSKLDAMQNSNCNVFCLQKKGVSDDSSTTF